MSDSTVRQICRRCGHDRDTHHAEVLTYGLATQTRERVHGRCLAAWCDCLLYLKPKGTA